MSQQIEQPGYQRLQVTDQEQMTWKNDKLNREPYANRLTTLIKNTEGPYVIGLTSPWGSGKTFFLQAWHGQLVKRDKPCIYFNAWEMDASGDPLANLMAVCKQQADTFQSTTGRLKEKVKKAFEHLPGVIRGAGNLANYLGVPVGGAAEASAKLIEKIQDILKEKDTFKRQLAELASEIAAEKNFPLFIIIDELDRCRPSYAIDLLESIKHLFNVPHVVFLLAVDSTQLLQQVEHTFGLKACIEDGKIVRDPRQEYLGKFFDIYYDLPLTDKAKFIENMFANMKIIEMYSRKFMYERIDINIKFGLDKILTADKTIFHEKSLRNLIQRVELFSIYLRCYDNIDLDEIIIAFIIIFTKEYEYKDSIGNELSDITTAELKKLESNIVDPNHGIYWDKNYDNVYTPEFCAYMFIKFSMIDMPYDMLKKYTAYRSAGYGYQFGKTFTPEGTMKTIRLKKFTEVAPTVIARLRYLEDFTPVLPVEETSSAAGPLTTPSA